MSYYCGLHKGQKCYGYTDHMGLNQLTSLAHNATRVYGRLKILKLSHHYLENTDLFKKVIFTIIAMKYFHLEVIFKREPKAMAKTKQSLTVCCIMTK